MWLGDLPFERGGRSDPEQPTVGHYDGRISVSGAERIVMDDARTPVTVLALLASSADREALRAIIGHSKWKLRFEERLGDVRQVFNGEDVGVILSDCTLPDGHSW